MKRRHFEALRPLCPVCRLQQREQRLELSAVLREQGEVVLEGILLCSYEGCQREYPIIDGIPIIIAKIREYMSQNQLALLRRSDLSACVESLLGDCAGPGSLFDAERQQLGTYGYDHYGDLDPGPVAAAPAPGSLRTLLARALELSGEPGPGPVLDVGCAVGRAAFELAERCDGLVLGVDVSFAMLRLASQVLHQGRVRYPLRQLGLVYERRDFPVALAGADRVDFWACDAAALPFAAASFALAASFNVLDCVAAPAEHLASLAHVLEEGAAALISTPYDWSVGATPVEAWLGGHSQRSAMGGSSAEVLRALLTPGAHPAAISGLSFETEERGMPWSLRLHARARIEYQVHLLIARARRLHAAP